MDKYIVQLEGIKEIPGFLLDDEREKFIKYSCTNLWLEQLKLLLFVCPDRDALCLAKNLYEKCSEEILNS